MVRLALRVRKGGLWAWLIRRWSRSAYDHCELEAGGGYYSSLLWSGGVVKRDKPASGEYEYIDLDWATPEQIEQHYADTQDHAYDVIGIIFSQIINMRWHSPHAATCSEWCAEALDLPNAEIHSPGTLAKLCEAINKITVMDRRG